MCQNGMLIRCPGLFAGELIVQMEPDNKSIVFAMLASNPDYELVTSIFFEMIRKSYPQYIHSFFIVIL
jgi:hypothetical protein